MRPYTFRRNEARYGNTANPFGSESKRRTLNFQGQHIALSVLLCSQLGVKPGCHLAFTFDEDHPERIFVRRADDVDDTSAIQMPLSRIRQGSDRLRCTNKAVVRHVLDAVGAINSCTCYVAPVPTRVAGKDHYQILTSCPVLLR